MLVNGIVSIFFGENRTISFTCRASHFVDKLLTLENAMLLIPMPRFVLIELIVSDLWPFETAIVGNRQIDKLTDRQND